VQTLVLTALAGLALGALVTWLTCRSTQASLSATLEAERRATADKLATLERFDARLKDSFSALSSQALKDNSHTFVDLATQLVRPVQDGLKLVDDKLQAFDKERAASAASLHEHLRQVALGQQQLQGETHNLVTALRAPQVRGRWGELQLRRVVELAGMQDHCDFGEQTTVATADGRTLRPDLTVKLPGDKVVVVDSKTPLEAYLDAMNATDEAERNLHLDRHARTIRDHVSDLAAKDYANQFTHAPDFVVLFIPGESFLSAACLRDPNLIEFAITKGVIPASPTTLITVLKAVAYGWQQERIAANAEQIRDLGQELYDRMATVADHLAKIRKGLETAVSSYNEAVGSIERRVLPTARKFRDLGVTQSEEIDLLDPVNTLPRLPSAPELV
jgi:DNA recombination protein RmuC